jgi:hypothetical protein
MTSSNSVNQYFRPLVYSGHTMRLRELIRNVQNPDASASSNINDHLRIFDRGKEGPAFKHLEEAMVCEIHAVSSQHISGRHSYREAYRFCSCFIPISMVRRRTLALVRSYQPHRLESDTLRAVSIFVFCWVRLRSHTSILILHTTQNTSANVLQSRRKNAYSMIRSPIFFPKVKDTRCHRTISKLAREVVSEGRIMIFLACVNVAFFRVRDFLIM